MEEDAELGNKVSGEEEESSALSTESGFEWVAWFLSRRKNTLFCPVNLEYIKDDFNLTGLSSMVRVVGFSYVLLFILT